MRIGVTMPKKAMILAAGLGLRMRPITEKTPKALVPVRGETLIDRTLDRLQRSGVETVVVNLHHLGDKIRRHLSKREKPETVFSDEAELLETGGGIKKALPMLGDDPFFAINGDALWLNGPTRALERMAERWNEGEMDALLLLHSTVDAYGYEGMGDFVVDPVGSLTRRDEREAVPYLFTGIQMVHPRVFKDTPDGKFSMNVIYDRLIEAGRLFGIIHDGEWFHIGTPGGLTAAEDFLDERYPDRRRRF
ncbi:MAG: nucleotidyltransferase family protein [Rhodospirillales bacterium]|nr:nucleotidyltransferase family protein [Rhodospirillales bacterium]MCW8862175.1 nucleotidyltransferase family protein [Rhodospirillales bacterium]MCW8952951.1 nucleotidyltransferase family protein [Rhodospirillales bacterium]MCW8969798.1 nucleotidyltransferase family protein [Rhodospirillales bacterium]MCW9002915.1 nucleotidyltransferase family protein [Rhodospirillales bacterium]